MKLECSNDEKQPSALLVRDPPDERRASFAIRVSTLIRHSDFVIRHSSFDEPLGGQG